MHRKIRLWILLCLLAILAAGGWWRFLRSSRPAASSQPSAQNTTAAPLKGPGAGQAAPNAPLLVTGANPPAAAVTNATAKAFKSPLTNRLSNTSRPIAELMRDDRAVLLRNALIDTTGVAGLPIPAHLRADGDPGSYVVQSRTPLDDAFRAQLKAAGASIVSYIPNNAYLVRVAEAGAKQLQASPQTQSVLPWEPYYKLDLALLPLAIHQQPLPDGTQVSVLLFPGERESGFQFLKALGAEIVGEDRSPFGHQVIVQPPADSLVALAKNPIVQGIELHRPRQLLNDLARVRTSIATNSSTPTDHLGLSGSGVLVGVNDTGVDGMHFDLAPRVFGATTDLDGHGTHVIGTILSSGASSPTPGTNASGSVSNANFRGAAPNAKAFVQSIDLITGPILGDSYLQETAARTNAFISNNSWSYFGIFDYNLASASYDAAVRDALPGEPGSQPLLFVFAAGNSGEGDDAGQGGVPDTIVAPANAKNVITVGAMENFRQITNTAVDADGMTNQPFLGSTDSANEVAAFSSRGNVGVGQEGPNGRFKPDVVAPGTFVVSTRSKDWKDPTVNTAPLVSTFTDQQVAPNGVNPHNRFIPTDANQLNIRTLPNARSPNPFPALRIYGHTGAAPDPTVPGDFIGTGSALVPVTPGTIYFYSIVNSNSFSVDYDLQTILFVTNNPGSYFTVLSNLNARLAPSYRYESGTSMAAPLVSGMLALMQEFFEQRLGRTNSPALMKALVINGARSVGPAYSLQSQTSTTLEGWGLPELTNSLPRALNTGAGTDGTWPIVMFDQSPTNALATGQSHSWTLTFQNTNTSFRLNPLFSPLRVTLVWTDPPGNPAASLKLVNDLDLIVSNNIPPFHEVYVGNNFPAGNDFSAVSDTNSPSSFNPDVVNNVENVYIDAPLYTSYTITVRARRVNVNAVTSQTNGVLQDYALVISSGNSSLTNTFSVSPVARSYDPTVFVRGLSNGVPLLHERVGANNPLLSSNVPNSGVANQWNFYVYTNTTFFTNVAIATFLPPDLSRTRYLDADIDLYVTPDRTLTNLDVNAIANARKSLSRGGSELVIFTNAAPGSILYVGVKSEDQQAAEFGIIAIASNAFGDRDKNGNIRLNFVPIAFDVPDGSPEAPQAGVGVGIIGDPAMVRRLVLTNVITHENGGDLIGILQHNQKSAVLNNHRSFTGTASFIYDDSREGGIPGSQPTDGPGTLRNFVGEPAYGLWTLTMIDNAPTHTGRVDFAAGSIAPQQMTPANGGGIILTVAGNSWVFASCDVPIGVTNLIVWLRQKDPLALDLYVRFGDFPDIALFDKYAHIIPPGGEVSIGLTDRPPLRVGRYYVGISNPNPSSVTFTQGCTLQYSLTPVQVARYDSINTPMALIDDAVANSVITVPDHRLIDDVKVGVRIDHPRLSDLVLHLVSPQGRRILLAENRGGTTATNYGSGFLLTNVFPQTSSGGAAESRTVIDAGQNSGVVNIDYEFFEVPDTLRIYYNAMKIFDSGYVSGSNTISVPFGPGPSNQVTIVINEGNNSDPNSRWVYTATIVSGSFHYATFTDNANLGPPIKFAVPPFSIIQTDLLLFASSFEGIGTVTNAQGVASNYVRLDTVSGIGTNENWFVLTNGCAVLTDTNNANSGTNLLALSNARVQAALPTVPDHEYRLSFAYEKVSSAPTQQLSVAVPGLANLYRHLSVSNGPAGANLSFDAVAVPKVRLCPGQEIAIAATDFCPFNPPLCVFWIFGPPEGLTNQLFQGLPLFSLIGCWSHSPNVLDSNTVASEPFFIGTNNIVNAPTLPGDYYLFLGVNNDDYNANIVITNFLLVTANWQQCQLTTGDYVLGSTTNALTAEYPWQNPSFLFAANPTTTNLILQPDINYTMLFDSFRLVEPINRAYFLSEETMAPFQGQLAEGDWTLEMWDNRSGPVADPGKLLSWQLDFVYANETSCLSLTNGIRYEGDVRGDEIRCFMVAVPGEITAAFNLLTDLGPGTGVDLLYSTTGPPTGNSPPDPVPPQPAGITFGLSTDFPPGAGLPLGGHYFLGVRNKNRTETNNFRLRVNFDVPIIPLQNNVPFVNQIPVFTNRFAGMTNSTLEVEAMQYYSFDVSTNAVSAVFRVSSRRGDVNLVLRRALPVVDLFPRPTFFDYESTTTFPDSELIIVNTNSLPVKLAPGRWYLGVYNVDTNAVTYTIRATQATTNLYSTIDLISGVATNFFVPPFSTLTSFYRLVADQTNAGVLFELCDLDGDADLIVRRADLPSRELYDFSNLELGSNPETIELRTNLFIPDVNATNWFIAIVNRDPSSNAVSGLVRASVLTTNAATNLCGQAGGTVPILVSGGTCHTSTLAQAADVDYYRVPVPSKVYRMDFITTTTGGDVGLYVQGGPSAALSIWPTNYVYSNAVPFVASRVVTVDTNSLPNPLLPGDWFVAVRNQFFCPGPPCPVTYTFCVIAYTNALPTIITLTNGVSFTNTVLAGRGVDYYVYDVSPDGIQATFEVLNPAGNVDLYIVQGLPLPDQTSFDASSANPGTSNESITLITNGVPVALSPGPWYLAVIDQETNNVNYAVRVTEILASSIVTLTNGTSFSNTVGIASALGSGNGPAGANAPASAAAASGGVDYYAFNISSNAVQANFETLQANGNVDLFISQGLPVPTPTSFDYASTNGGARNEFIAVATNSVPTPLSAGDWYLAVVNRDTNAVTYVVRVTEIQAASIIALTNAVPFNNQVAGADSPPSLGVEYYVFSVSSNAVQANFEILAPDGNVDLFVRQGLPLPDANHFDYSSTNPSVSNEFIAVATNSTPLALAPGDWYLAVVNRDPIPVNYAVRATQYVPATTNLVRLTNCLIHTAVVAANDPQMNNGLDYYVFTVSSNALTATFEVLSPSGNVDLFIGPDVPLPTPANFLYSSENPLNSDESIPVSVGIFYAFTSPAWYLAVVNRDPSNVVYSVRVTETIATTNGVIPLISGIPLQDRVAAGDGSCEVGINYYRFNVSSNALVANFEVLSPDGDVDLFIRPGFPLPIPGSEAYRSANPGLSEEFIEVTRNSVPVGLIPGDWYLAVVNRDTNAVTYYVRATQWTPTNFVVLTNGPAYCHSVPAASRTNSGADYYVIHVASDTVELDLAALQLSGDVNLYLRNGLPLPGPRSFDYVSANPGLVDETIRVLPGSSPVPLSSGDWYLAVVNAETNDAPYCLCIIQYSFSAATIVRLTNGIPFNFNIASELPCDDGRGPDYYVYNVSSNAARAQFEVLQAAPGGAALFVRKGLPLPDLLSFDYKGGNGLTPDAFIAVFTNARPVPLSAGDWYIGVFHGAVTNYQIKATEFSVPGTNLIITKILQTGNQLCLTWTNALPGVRYFVQGTFDLVSSPWLPASTTIMATNSAVTYCLSLPTPYKFFRIAEGWGLPDGASSATATNLTIMPHRPNGYLLSWNSSPNQQFGVSWSRTMPATYWNTFTNIVTATNNSYFFFDDGSQTGGLKSPRFYRLFSLP